MTEEIKTIKVQDTEFECSSLFDFSSLVKLLYELSKRQNSIETRIEKINTHIFKNDNSNLEIDSNDQEDLNENQISHKKKSKSRQQNDINQQTSEIEGVTEEKEEEESVTINNNTLMKLSKKVKDNVKKISDLSKKSIEHQELNVKIKENKNVIEDHEKKLNYTNNSINDINKKLNDINNVLEDMKIKVQDFNIYDIFKSDGTDGGNIDVAKALIINLENKVFKKFDLYDERLKSMDGDIFKLKDNFKNNMALIDGAKMTSQKCNETLTIIKDKYSEEINQLNEKLNDISNEFNNLNSSKKKLSNNILLDKPLDNKELQNLSEAINTELKKMQTDIEQNKKSIKNTNDDIEYLRKFFNELEKQIGKEINDMNIDDLRIKVQNLEEEMNHRKKNEEINDIKKKLLVIEELIKDQEFKNETTQQTCERIRGDISQITKKVEYLNQEYVKLSLGKIAASMASNEQKEIPIDLTKFLEVTKFNDNKKEVNNKFEKVRLAIENLGRNLENIIETLSHTPSDKDFEQFQGVIKNLIDEKNILYFKKFADKIDVNKNIKYLETQIKNYFEMNNKKLEGGDNWLLANKPIHNYQCASCEGIIRGDLDKRAEFVPWNKYPSREDKNYRMGHGFSRMLQLVNDDIMKSTNNNDLNINNQHSNKINEDDKKNVKKTIVTETNNESRENVKLPKVKTKIANLINNTEDIYNIDKASTIPLYDDYGSTSLNPSKPQILRIYKLNKKNNASSGVINRGINFNRMQRTTDFKEAGNHNNLSMDES